MTGDKDLTQLLQGSDFWWDFARNVQLDKAGVFDKFGVPASAIQDYLGLCGDAVDNIPGCARGSALKQPLLCWKSMVPLKMYLIILVAVAGLPVRGAKTLRAKLEPFKRASPYCLRSWQLYAIQHRSRSPPIL